MTDQEHAKAVREVTAALNAVIHAAHMAGLRVECEVVSFQSVEDLHERQQIVAVVSRVIE